MAGNFVRIGASVNDQVSGPLDRIRDKFDTMGKGAASASLVGNVGAMALAKGVSLLGDAAGRAVDFIGDSIEAASSLSETASKSKVIFGQSAGEMDKFGDSAARSMGISKQATLEAGATFGNFFTGLGQSQPVAAQMSKAMVTLASDLASFNNMDPTETLDKLRAGLAGEAEPLRRLGVFLTEAKVKTKAMEMGLADAHGELTEGAKVQARYALILQETTTAQGDFARTSEGLANSQRIAAAATEDAMAKMGKSMEPMAIQVENTKLAMIDFITRGLEGWALLGDVVGGKQKELVGSTISMAKDMEAGGKAIQDMAKRTADTLAYRFETGGDRAKVAMNDSMGSIEDRMRDTRSTLSDLAKTIISDAFDPQIRAAEITATKFELADLRKERSAKGLTRAEKNELDLRILNSEKHLATLRAEQDAYQADAGASAAQHQADLLAAQTQYQIDAETKASLNQWGQKWVHTAALGVSGGIDEVYTAGNQIVATMQGLDANGYPIGASFAKEVASGIANTTWVITKALAAISAMMIGTSPPKVGPLKDIDKGARNVADAWTGAFAGRLQGSAGITNALSRLASVAGSGPAAASGGLSTAMSAVGGGSPAVIQINLDGRTIASVVDRNLYYARGAAGRLPSG